ncbi:MAG: hypothetical protein J0L77_01105 [Alphaproteobacteria bacterium]|nr:hypothetical protein [Alphaproteobacteria bacterium]
MTTNGQTDITPVKPDGKKGGFGHGTRTEVRKIFLASLSLVFLSVSAEARDLSSTLSSVSAHPVSFIFPDYARPGSSDISAPKKNTTLTDPCFPLLRATPLPVSDRRTWPSAGENAAPVAALAFILGARSVVPPVNARTHRPHGLNTASGVLSDRPARAPSPALSIALWRQCKNQMSVHAMTR